MAAESFPNEEQLWQELVLSASRAGQHDNAVDFSKGAIHHHPRSVFCDELLKRKPVSCPFERVLIKKAGDTWSVGLTHEDADRFVWVKPRTNVLIGFTEWTRSGLLRHAGLL